MKKISWIIFLLSAAIYAPCFAQSGSSYKLYDGKAYFFDPVSEPTKSIEVSDREAIEKTLMHYIEGTEVGNPERLKKAFHEDLNLYTINEGQLKITSGKKYITYFESGKKSDRIGKIVSIDYAGEAAMAKIEVKMPGRKRLYTDYLMLLKVEGTWKIIHKSYSFKTYN